MPTFIKSRRLRNRRVFEDAGLEFHRAGSEPVVVNAERIEVVRSGSAQVAQDGFYGKETVVLASIDATEIRVTNSNGALLMQHLVEASLPGTTLQIWPTQMVIPAFSEPILKVDGFTWKVTRTRRLASPGDLSPDLTLPSPIENELILTYYTSEPDLVALPVEGYWVS